MNSEEREVIEYRIKELKRRVSVGRIYSDNDSDSTLRLQGNIGAFEWVLREFPEPVEAKCK